MKIFTGTGQDGVHFTHSILWSAVLESVVGMSIFCLFWSSDGTASGLSTTSLVPVVGWREDITST